MNHLWVVLIDRPKRLKHLSAQTFSDEVALRKPRAVIFLRTLAALGVEPREAFHAQDTPGTDIAGAVAISMRKELTAFHPMEQPSPRCRTLFP